jgi:hypothetical protein
MLNEFVGECYPIYSVAPLGHLHHAGVDSPMLLNTEVFRRNKHTDGLKLGIVQEHGTQNEPLSVEICR